MLIVIQMLGKEPSRGQAKPNESIVNLFHYSCILFYYLHVLWGITHYSSYVALFFCRAMYIFHGTTTGRTTRRTHGQRALRTAGRTDGQTEDDGTDARTDRGRRWRDRQTDGTDGRRTTVTTGRTDRGQLYHPLTTKPKLWIVLFSISLAYSSNRARTSFHSNKDGMSTLRTPKCENVQHFVKVRWPENDLPTGFIPPQLLILLARVVAMILVLWMEQLRPLPWTDQRNSTR